MNLPTLDQTVRDTLAFYATTPPPILDLSAFSLPFVVGSGNAINTGKILFADKAAIFADESSFRQTVGAYDAVVKQGLVKDAVVISASGEKDSVWEVEFAKEKGLKTTLLTCKPNSSAAKIADAVVSYKSIAEPYTYNTSTYLGMILSATHEKVSDIQAFIDQLAFPAAFSEYSAYAFVLPDAYGSVTPMVEIKGQELFGPHMSLRAYPDGHARHAKFVHPTEKELVIQIGVTNEYYGLPAHRWNIELPKDASFGLMLAATYYICGRIQTSKPPYFMQDIEGYCADYGPKAYGKDGTFEVLVPATT